MAYTANLKFHGEVVPKAHAWEEQGFVPRALLREMGRLGFLGLRLQGKKTTDGVFGADGTFIALPPRWAN